MSGKKKNKKVKKRIPLPLKPPKIEDNPKAYKRREKHQKDLLNGDDSALERARERD